MPLLQARAMAPVQCVSWRALRGIGLILSWPLTWRVRVFSCSPFLRAPSSSALPRQRQPSVALSRLPLVVRWQQRRKAAEERRRQTELEQTEWQQQQRRNHEQWDQGQWDQEQLGVAGPASSLDLDQQPCLGPAAVTWTSNLSSQQEDGKQWAAAARG
jgi:hypothetical protein